MYQPHYFNNRFTKRLKHWICNGKPRTNLILQFNPPRGCNTDWSFDRWKFKASILLSEIFDIIIKCGKLFNDDCFIYYTRRCTVPVYNVQLDFEGRYKETLGIFSTLLSEEECSIHTFTRHLWTPHARYQSYQHFYAAYNLMRLYAHVELSGKERQRCKKCYLHGKQSRNLLVEEYSMPILASNIVLIFSPFSYSFFFFFYYATVPLFTALRNNWTLSLRSYELHGNTLRKFKFTVLFDKNAFFNNTPFFL